jgi:hypothetical protein
MPDISAIAALINSFSAAQNIAKGFLDLKSITDVQSKVIELQAVIMSAQNTALAAQAEHAALLNKLQELKSELATLQRWEDERQNYHLVAVDTGVFAYELTKESASAEPMHWLCANCFAQGEKSILQSAGDVWGTTKHECARCKSHIEVRSGKQPSPISYPSQGIV